MAPYYAKSENGKGERETVQHHLYRTGELCAGFLRPISYDDWGEAMGCLHDFGKFSEDFQLVLSGEKHHINHALPGAVAAQGLYQNVSGMAAVIASHHDKLQSYDRYAETIKSALRGADKYDNKNNRISLCGKDAYEKALSLWKHDFHPVRLRPAPRFSSSENPSLSRTLFTRFLFSALIDADWSSSAEHYDAEYLNAHTGPPLDAEAALSRLLALRESKRRNSASARELNQMRDALFDQCLEAGAKESGLFTLTAPTGLGKTISLMAFALKHCIVQKKRRIILVLPYLSIIEQNVREYRKIIPELLEIHSNVHDTDAAKQLAERWDAPCIVTTNVRFFESLFSAQPRCCRHLHQLANSVIVLDEAQTLPPELLNATLRTIKELSEHYGCTFVLSTATQPSFEFRKALSWSPCEIIPDPRPMYHATRRTHWHWHVDEPVPLESIAEEMAKQSQCCAILNLKKHAAKLYESLLSQGDAESVFYLTTELCPAHRSDILNEIDRRLAEGLPCKLVATQCIEAGVDLDFPVIYRALAPLDSLIQAAGRCNRNGSLPSGDFFVFLPKEDRLYPSNEYARGALCVMNLLHRHEIDPCSIAHIKAYYELLYSLCGEDKRSLTDAIDRGDYPEVDAQYRLIDNTGLPVIVPYSGRDALYREIRDRFDRAGATYKLLCDAREITVTSFHIAEIRENCEEMTYYDPETRSKRSAGVFLLGNRKHYDKRRGLRFDESFDGIID